MCYYYVDYWLCSIIHQIDSVQDKTRQDKTFTNIVLQVQFFGTKLARKH